MDRTCRSIDASQSCGSECGNEKFARWRRPSGVSPDGSRRAVRMRFLVVAQDALTGVVKLLELPGHHGPDEDAADQQHRQRDQQVQRFHQCRVRSGRRRARSALAITSNELAAMPAAATAGETWPKAASGMMTTL